MLYYIYYGPWDEPSAEALAKVTGGAYDIGLKAVGQRRSNVHKSKTRQFCAQFGTAALNLPDLDIVVDFQHLLNLRVSQPSLKISRQGIVYCVKRNISQLWQYLACND